MSGINPRAMITDPPYPEKYLHLYGELAKLCAKIKVPLVAVMCGQSYLPQIMADMGKYLKYRWTMAYLTPGGQAVQQWEAKVNCFWKPVLLFGEAADWIGDVVSSDANDNDKQFHSIGHFFGVDLAGLVSDFAAGLLSVTADLLSGGLDAAISCFADSLYLSLR